MKNPEGKDLGADGMIILKTDLQRSGMVENGLDLSSSGHRQVAGSCEHSNDPLGSTKCGKFLDQLRTYKLLEKNFAPWSKLVS